MTHLSCHRGNAFHDGAAALCRCAVGPDRPQAPMVVLLDWSVRDGSATLPADVDRACRGGIRLCHSGIALCAAAFDRIGRSEEHTSELQSLMRISYAVFCLKQKKQINKQH